MSSSVSASTSDHQTQLHTLDKIRGVPGRVLEIGCASGTLLPRIKQRGAQYCCGFEIDPDQAAIASRQEFVDEVVVGDFEQAWTALPRESFDVVIANNIIEHFVNPWQAVRSIEQLLRPGGQLVGVVPNVRHLSIVLPLLLRGQWRYQDTGGILFRSHLRFFTREGIHDLLSDGHLVVDSITPEFWGPRSKLAVILSFGLLRDLAAGVYVFSATKPSRS